MVDIRKGTDLSNGHHEMFSGALVSHPSQSLTVSCLRYLWVRLLLLAPSHFLEMDTAVNTEQPVLIATRELVHQSGKRGSR